MPDRELKFRAWDEDLEMMIYSDKQYDDMFFEFKNGTLKAFYLTESQSSNLEYMDPICNEIQNPLMQFTGLWDKYGKEIYEGDIVKDNHPFVPHKKIQYVEWLDEGACFIFRDKSGNDWWCPNCDYVGARMTIIGNIYENQDLLSDTPLTPFSGDSKNDKSLKNKVES